MGERMEMEIVGKNSTGKGWDQVEQDAKARARRINNTLNSDGGLFGGKPGADKSMQGKGFMEAFGKAIRGDFSGAIEDMQARMGAGMKSMTGKALIWGGGIATALAAGWKAGKALDDMFGISDKVAAAWNRAAVVAGYAWDKFYKSLRAKRLQQEAEIQSAVEIGAKVFDIREKAKMKRMSPGEKVNYLESGIETLERTSRASGISLDEQKERKIMLEEMKSDYQDALDEMNKAWEESSKAEYAAQKAAEDEKLAAKKRNAEVEQDFVRMGIRDEITAIQDAIKKRDAQNAADMAGLEARKAKLQQLAALENVWKNEGAIAADPNNWRAQQKADKDAEREKRRREKMHAEAEAAIARGVKIPHRWQALLDADHAAEAAGQAGRQLRGLEKLAAEAQIKAQKDIEGMRKNLDGLNKRLDAALTMGGGA
ncbi:MAG: hypothetical protein WCI03_03645 [bacterium]